jgi:hypothetical protein
MQRISQLSSHLTERSIYSSASNSTITPHQTVCDNPANTNTTMAKTKVVVTRQLIHEAQSILDAKKEELDIVQWNSEKVRCTKA